jgi:phospholipid-binding lipoprotein MlaA
MSAPGIALRTIVLAAVLVCLGVCGALAAAPDTAPAAETKSFDDDYGPPPVTIADPLEGLNRAFFAFNDGFYFNVLKPVSHGYGLVVPGPFRSGIRNAYDNMLFPVRFINSLLQLNCRKAANELGRFMLNTVFGVGGLFEVASGTPGLKPQEADFGQTLGIWGVGHGFYFVIPFLGPSSLRDGLGRLGDLGFSPLTYATQPFFPPAWYWSWVPRLADGVNDASLRQGEYEAFKNASVEPYAAMRDAYAQYRREIVGKNAPRVLRGQ